MIRRHPFLAIIILLILGGGAYFYYRTRQPKPLEVRTAEVERTRNLRQTVTASGEIRAHEMIDIQAEIPGVIVDLPVKEGQTIKKGDILLKINPFQVQMTEAGARGQYGQAEAEIRRSEASLLTSRANLNRQREAVRAAEAAVEQARVTLERDKNSLARYQRLLESRAISRDQFENIEARARISQTSLDSALAQVDQARAQLVASETEIKQTQASRDATIKALQVNQAQLSQASDEVNKATIVSPLNGVVVKLNVDVGERAVPGIQSNPEATLMTLANLSIIEAEIRVDETDIVKVQLNDPCDVEIDALPDHKLKGFISEIGQAPIQLLNSAVGSGGGDQEGRDFKVVVRIENPPPELRIGMSCETEILVEERKQVLTIPLQALNSRDVPVDEKNNYLPPPRPLRNNKQASNDQKSTRTKEIQGVFLFGEDDMAHFRPVATGIMGDSNIEVTSGLKERELVITGPLAALRELEEWKAVKKLPLDAASDRRGTSRRN